MFSISTSTRSQNLLAIVVAASSAIAIAEPANAQENVVNTTAGTGVPGYSGDNGPAIAATIQDPHGIAVAADGTIYFADTGNFVIRKIDTSGTITTVAGSGVEGDSGDGGDATLANISFVPTIALSPLGDALYIADTFNNRIRKIDFNAVPPTIDTFAGGGFGFGGDLGPAAAALMSFPDGVATAPDGSVWIADSNNCRIRRVSGGIIDTVSGDGTCSSGGENVAASSATWFFPTRISVSPAGDVFIVDGNDTVRRISADLSDVDTVAGGGFTVPGFGPATDMALGGASDVVADAAGNIYIATFPRVLKVDLSSGLLSVFAGTEFQGFSGDGGPALAAQFNGINSLGFQNDTLVIADGQNSRLRAVTPAPALPEDLIIELLTTQEFIDQFTSVPGSVLMINVNGRDFLIAHNLTDVGNNVEITGNTGLLAIDLDALASAGGDINVTGNLQLTSLDLSALTNVTGSLTIDGNPVLDAILIGGVTSIGGNLTVIGSAATVINAASLVTVTGNLTIEDNDAMGNLDLGGLTSVGGGINVSNNDSMGSLDLTLLTDVIGSLTIDDNDSMGTLDLGSLTDVGGINVSGNASLGLLDLSALDTVTGDLTVVDNGSATVNVGSLDNVTGNLTLESTGTGTLDLTGGDATGNLTLDVDGYTEVSGTTPGGDADITMGTADAIMHVQIKSASFATPVNFTITRHDPIGLVPEAGTDSGGGAATIDPIAAYQYSFAIAVPTLNHDASLTIDIVLAGLDGATQAAVLQALADGTITMVTRGDAAGATYQAFAVCTGADVPVPDGCVKLETLDAGGAPTNGTPAIVRFSNVVGHFSTWGVAIVTSTGDTCPTPSTDLCSDLTGYTPIYNETLPRNPGETLVVDRTFTGSDPKATVVIHNNGCTQARVTLNGDELVGLGDDLGALGACFTVDVGIDTANNNNLQVTLPASSTSATFRHSGGRCGGGGGDHDSDGGSDHDSDHDSDNHHHGHCNRHGDYDSDDSSDHRDCDNGDSDRNSDDEDTDHDSNNNGDSDSDGDSNHDNDSDGDTDSNSDSNNDGDTDSDSENDDNDSDDDSDGKVTICHERMVGGYREITIDASAVAAHANHHDRQDIIPAPAGGCPDGHEGEGEGEPGGEGEGEGEGEPDVGCSVTVTVVELTECPSNLSIMSESANHPWSFMSCSSTDAGPTATTFGALLAALFVARRRRR